MSSCFSVLKTNKKKLLRRPKFLRSAFNNTMNALTTRVRKFCGVYGAFWQYNKIIVTLLNGLANDCLFYRPFLKKKVVISGFSKKWTFENNSQKFKNRQKLNFQAVGMDSGVQFSLSNFLEDILQPTSSKMSPTSNLGL